MGGNENMLHVLGKLEQTRLLDYYYGKVQADRSAEEESWWMYADCSLIGY